MVRHSLFQKLSCIKERRIKLLLEVKHKPMHQQVGCTDVQVKAL